MVRCWKYLINESVTYHGVHFFIGIFWNIRFLLQYTLPCLSYHLFRASSYFARMKTNHMVRPQVGRPVNIEGLYMWMPNCKFVSKSPAYSCYIRSNTITNFVFKIGERGKYATLFNWACLREYIQFGLSVLYFPQCQRREQKLRPLLGVHIKPSCIRILKTRPWSNGQSKSSLDLTR